MRKISLTVLMVAIIVAFGCKKEEELQEPVIEEYLSFKLNDTLISLDPIAAYLYENQDYIRIQGAIDVNDDNRRIAIFLDTIIGHSDSYIFSPLIGSNVVYTDHLTHYSSTRYARSISNNAGVAVITLFDKEKNIIEGTFELKALNSETNLVKNITEGKFRINYKDEL